MTQVEYNYIIWVVNENAFERKIFLDIRADMLLYREGYYNCFLEDSGKNICEVIIITQSDNHLKTVELFWLDNLLLFANISEKTEQESYEDCP